MAENPATWGPVEKLISETIKMADDRKKDFVCGLSTPALIALRLREAGLLAEGA